MARDGNLDPAEHAHDLREEGLHVFPVERRGKKPLVPWAAYQTREPSDEEFEGWQKRWPGCNWGVATGVGVIVVDADTEEGVAFMRSGAVTRSPREVITSKGAHFYYSVHPSLTVTNSAGKHIDIRGFGGYVVAEGSVHESGHVYERKTLPGFGDVSAAFLPSLNKDDLIAIAAFNRRDSIINGPIVVAGQLNFDATTVDPDFNDQGGPITDKWVAPGERNVAASRLAGKYIGQGHDLQTVKAMLDEWNANNPAPLSQSELNTTIASVARTHTRKNPQQPVPIEPKPLEEIQVYDLFDLVNDPRELPPYLITGLFRRGDNVVLGGPPKSQKSFLLQDMLYSMAFGKEFLGFEVPHELTVAWVQAEMPWYESKKRAAAHPLVAERLASGRPSNMFVTDRLTTLAFDPRGVEYMTEILLKRFEGEVPSVLAIDSLAAVWAEENENDNAQMQVFLRERLGHFREVFGPELTIILVHHSSKVGKREMRNDPFSALRGASALRGWYSAGMVMFRDPDDPLSPKREVHFELRGDREPEPLAVHYEDGVMKRYEAPVVDATAWVMNVIEQEFMNWFDAFTEEGRPLHGSARAKTGYAPREFVDRKIPDKAQVKARKSLAAQYTEAMNNLVARGVLVYVDTRVGGSKMGTARALRRANDEE